MKPIAEQEAEENVKKSYEGLKNGLKISHVPLFFTYIGPFPEYLDYLTKQIVPIINNSRFEELNRSLGTEMTTLIHTMLPDNPEAALWRERYQNSPSFYHLRQHLSEVYRTNMTLALLFVALRESVKGWAVAAQQLPSSVHINEEKRGLSQELENQILMEDYDQRATSLESLPEMSRNDMVKTESGIERNRLPEYLALQQSYFFQIVKKDTYVYLRVYIEELLLRSIHLFPHALLSPINVVLDLTSQYKDFPELLYLISDHFPTLAVQKLIFSGYISE